MTTPVEDRLHQFARDLLERQGSLVDWPEHEDQGLAVLSEQTAKALGCPETVTLSHRAGEAAGDTGLTVSLATDFLERVEPLLSARPRVGAFQVRDLYLKKGDLRDAVARTFSWLNARVTVRATQAGRVDYHLWYLLAALQSEEPWEEIIRVDVNSASGAVIEVADIEQIQGLEPNPQGSIQPDRTYGQATRRAQGIMRKDAAEFLTRVGVRHERDRQRLRDYYNALKEQPARRRKDQPERTDKEWAQRRQVVELERDRKLAELDERYAVRAGLSPITMASVELPVLMVDCEVLRRQARGGLYLYWNPISKALEPIACPVCGENTFSVGFTDDKVEPRCAKCLG